MEIVIEIEIETYREKKERERGGLAFGIWQPSKRN